MSVIRGLTAILALFVFLLGCGESDAVNAGLAAPGKQRHPKELNRGTVRRILEVDFYPKKITAAHPIGRRMVAAHENPLNKKEQSHAELFVAELLEEKDATNIWGRPTGKKLKVYRVSIAPEGEKYVRQLDPPAEYKPETAWLHACDEVLIDVMGLRFNGDKNKAIAQVTTRYSDPTPFWSFSPRGQCWRNPDEPETVETHELAFELWDDGWRFVENPDPFIFAF